MNRIDEITTGVNREQGLVSIEFIADGTVAYAVAVELAELDKLIGQLQDTREAMRALS